MAARRSLHRRQPAAACASPSSTAACRSSHPDPCGQIAASETSSPIARTMPRAHGTAVAGIVAARADDRARHRRRRATGAAAARCARAGRLGARDGVRTLEPRVALHAAIDRECAGHQPEPRRPVDRLIEPAGGAALTRGIPSSPRRSGRSRRRLPGGVPRRGRGRSTRTAAARRQGRSAHRAPTSRPRVRDLAGQWFGSVVCGGARERPARAHASTQPRAPAMPRFSLLRPGSSSSAAGDRFLRQPGRAGAACACNCAPAPDRRTDRAVSYRFDTLRLAAVRRCRHRCRRPGRRRREHRSPAASALIRTIAIAASR